MKLAVLSILCKFLRRKLAVILLIAVSAVTAFATLGDGKIKYDRAKGSLLSNKTKLNSHSFSLKSGYTFRGNQVINTKNEKYISLNTVITYQRGNTTYILPLKKKVILDKITFNPNTASRLY